MISSGADAIEIERKCTINVVHFNHPETIYPSIHRKTVFHKTGPWCQKVWGPLFYGAGFVCVCVCVCVCMCLKFFSKYTEFCFGDSSWIHKENPVERNIMNAKTSPRPHKCSSTFSACIYRQTLERTQKVAQIVTM